MPLRRQARSTPAGIAAVLLALLTAAAAQAHAPAAIPGSAPGSTESASANGREEVSTAPAAHPGAAAGGAESEAIEAGRSGASSNATSGNFRTSSGGAASGAGSVRAGTSGHEIGSSSRGAASDETTIQTKPAGSSTSAGESGKEGGAAAGGATSGSAHGTPSTVGGGQRAATPLAGVTRAGSAPAQSRALQQKSGARRSSGKRRAARRHFRHSAAGAAALQAAGASPGVGIGKGGTGRARPTRSRGAEPAIRTFERIVSVVPRPFWIMMAILAVLTTMLGIRSWLTSLEARRSERQRKALAKVVGTLQQALLPEVPAQIAGVRTSVAYRPAEGPAAGGDFYDIFTLEDGRIAVIVGDVAGHGQQALPRTALLRYTLRTYLDSGLPPRSALAAAAGALDRRLDGALATTALAILDPSRHLLTYSCAGHPPPLILGTEARPITCAASPPIGAGARTGLRQTEIDLPPGALVCFYTDGVIDARIGNELFGEERFRAALAALPPEATAEELLARIAAQASVRPDDMAACLLRIAPGRSAAGRASAAAAPGGSRAAHANGRPGPATPEIREELEVNAAALASGRPQQFLACAGLPADSRQAVVSSIDLVLGEAPAAIIRLSRPCNSGGSDSARVEIRRGGAGVIRLGKPDLVLEPAASPQPPAERPVERAAERPGERALIDEDSAARERPAHQQLAQAGRR